MLKNSNQGIRVAGLGNIFMDITAVVNQEFMVEFGLEPGKLVSARKVKSGFDQMLSSMNSKRFTLGGGAANSIRAFQVNNH